MTGSLSMQLRQDDQEFILRKLPSVQGWLLDDSAYFSSALVRWQNQREIPGGIFEIGVYAGKYLSLLYHLTQETSVRVLGVDTFQWCPLENTQRNFQSLFERCERLILHQADSTTLTFAEINGALSGKPRFISVDGAHTAKAVYSDLVLSQQLLAEGGIVAIDDVLNPRAIGVGEGAYRYFIDTAGKGLAPFAYCANKLYAASHDQVEIFSKLAWQFVAENPTLQVASEFNQLMAKGRDWVEQELFGFPVVIL